MPSNRAANSESIPSRNKTVYCCAILFLFISAVCQIIGLIAPWWITVAMDEISVQMGLFFTTICVFDTCQTESTNNFVEVYVGEVTADDLNEYRAMTILGMLMCIVALFAMTSLQCCCTITAKRLKIVLLVVVVGLILSGSLSMAAAGKLGRIEMKALETLPDGSVLGTPYAMISTGIGGVIAGILLFPMAVHTYTVWNQGDASPSEIIGPQAGPPAGPPAGQPYNPAAGGQMTFYSPVYSVTPTAPPLEAYHGYSLPNYDQNNYPTFPLRPPMHSQPLES